MAYEGQLTPDLLGDIINDIQHQGDTTQAMYAVAPHLVALSQQYSGDIGRDACILAGLIAASSQCSSAEVCPANIRPEFDQCLALGYQTILRHLDAPTDFDNFKYLVAALAGFSAHGRFGRILADFELFEGEFHHSSLDEPFPDPS